jgi:HEAT repeat protein
MTVCESLLLSRLGLSALPYSVLLASALTMGCSFLYSKWVGRHRNESSLLRLIALGVTIILAFVPLVFYQYKAAYVSIFAFHFVTFTILSSHLQAMAGDYFDTLSAKRILPLIGIGATLGEIVGGLAASTVTRFLPIESLLFAWAGFLMMAAFHTARNRSQLEIWNPHPESFNTDRDSRVPSASVWSLLKQSALNRSLLGAVCAMVLTMSMVQYVVSDVFVSTYPKDADLASFLGVFVAFTNTVELLLASQVTPRLLARAGVARTNMVHAVLALLTLSLLWNHYALVPAALAWMNRKTVHDALAGPTRTLVFNAVPLRERIPLMAFVMGVAGSAARATASLLLMVFQTHFAARTFILFGLAFALLYLLFVGLVAKHYLAALLHQISQSRLTLQTVETVGVENLPLLWAECLKTPENYDLEKLTDSLKDAGLVDLLEQGALNGPEEIRTSCVDCLGKQTPPQALNDPSSRVRLAAIRALWRSHDLIEPLCDDDDSGVSRLARAVCGRCESPETPEQLRFLHASQLASVKQALNDKDSARQIAALERLSGEPTVPLAELFAKARQRELAVSLAAVRSLAGSNDPMATVLLARCLQDSRARVRSTASELLSRRGPAIIPHVEGYFRSEREVVVQAAYHSFTGMSDSHTRDLLGRELRLMVKEAWKNLALRQKLRELNADRPCLELALSDRAARCQRLAFRLLGLLEGEAVVGSVVGTLRFSKDAGRSTALEVLSNLGDREAAGLLVLLTEPAPLEERLSCALKSSPSLANLPTTLTAIRAACAHSPGRYISLAAREARAPLLARLLRLHRFDILGELGLEDLEKVDELLQEELFGAGDDILVRDHACRKLYLVISGRVDTDSDILGEVTALDEGGAIATVRAETTTQTYSLAASSLQSLIRRQPAVAFPLISRLTRRIRENERTD